MTLDEFESIVAGARETDTIEVKGSMVWSKHSLVKDILAMANVLDGGAIIIGIEDSTFVKQGLTPAEVASFDYDVMRDQIDPYADPRVIFHVQTLTDADGLQFVVIEVSPFDELPVICAKDGSDVQAGTIYYRSRSRRPESARVARSEDMREIVEASVARRASSLRRAGFQPASRFKDELDAELGEL